MVGGSGVLVTPCAWFRAPDLFEPDDQFESCASGKPAVYRNCGYDDPVCEDHACRCRQPEPPSRPAPFLPTVCEVEP